MTATYFDLMKGKCMGNLKMQSPLSVWNFLSLRKMLIGETTDPEISKIEHEEQVSMGGDNAFLIWAFWPWYLLTDQIICQPDKMQLYEIGNIYQQLYNLYIFTNFLFFHLTYISIWDGEDHLPLAIYSSS